MASSSYNTGGFSPTRSAVSFIRSSCVIFSPACKSNKSCNGKIVKTRRIATSQDEMSRDGREDERAYGHVQRLRQRSRQRSRYRFRQHAMPTITKVQHVSTSCNGKRVKTRRDERRRAGTEERTDAPTVMPKDYANGHGSGHQRSR